MQINGWILDVYAAGSGMVVWVMDTEGAAHCLHDTLAPSFFVYGPDAELHAVCVMLAATRAPVRLRRAKRYDLFLRREIVVLEVQVEPPVLLASLFRRVYRFKPALSYYNADLAPAQFYYFAKRLFPLAHCEIEADAGGHIREIHALDSRWDLDYELPPLKYMFLRLEGEARNPNHGFRGPLEVQTDDGTRLLNPEDPYEMLVHLGELIDKYDPDVLISEYGDSFILPELLRLSKYYQVTLPLNRDPAQTPLYKKEYSYFSYGRIVYRASSQILFGRWHIDLRNAFLVDDYWLEGVFELARLTGLNVQKVVRTSTGTGISAMEAATAYAQNILIPYQKREPEDFKSAGDLVLTDKGGLTYRPILGLHENVAELDFVSMYPFIMAKFNISPETVNCPCCENQAVPEIGYSICRKRQGLIPATLEPLVAKRVRYKMTAKQLPEGPQREAYKRRSSAIKWILVTCFGYTGYKNARFGKIEAHESINAYARHALLQAKELVEARGFQVLHLLVDCLWVKKKDAREEDYRALIAEITHETGLPIALEGVYHWIAFLPAREHARLSVPNRYFGVFHDGTVKIRGIELRRRDTPAWIKQVQQQAIDILATAQNRHEFRERAVEVLDLISDALNRLESQQVNYRDLVLTYHLTRDPKEYRHNTLNAIVARALMERGVSLRPGESIQYIITAAEAACPSDRAQALELFDATRGYDSAKYGELLLRAMETILQPAGLNRSKIEEKMAVRRKAADGEDEEPIANASDRKPRQDRKRKPHERQMIYTLPLSPSTYSRSLV